MFGSASFRPLMLSSILLSLPKILFIGFTLRKFDDKNSLQATTEYKTLTIICTVLILLFTITEVIYLWVAGTKDPGMLKRNESSFASHDATIKIVHKGILKKTRMCPTCNICKPFRSAHCGDCDNCIVRFDHHCPWLGGCVGRRNYIYFFCFLIVVNLNNALTVVCCILHIVRNLTKYYSNVNKNEKNKWFAKSLCNCTVSIYTLLYIFVIMAFTSGLFLYHIKLIINNLTTKEEIKKLLHSKIGNYYNEGCMRNCQDFLTRREKHSILYTGKELRERIETKVIKKDTVDSPITPETARQKESSSDKKVEKDEGDIKLDDIKLREENRNHIKTSPLKRVPDMSNNENIKFFNDNTSRSNNSSVSEPLNPDNISEKLSGKHIAESAKKSSVNYNLSNYKSYAHRNINDIMKKSNETDNSVKRKLNLDDTVQKASSTFSSRKICSKSNKMSCIENKSKMEQLNEKFNKQIDEEISDINSTISLPKENSVNICNENDSNKIKNVL